jgi:phosphohistidine phosphatase
VTRTLLLLRHAKSSWADATIEDHDRPLQDKGRRRAAALAEWMDDRGIGCDLVLCSTALRARQTLDVVLPVLGKPEVRFEPAIYEASPEALLGLVRELDDGIERTMLVGHDPGLQQLATLLAMTATGDALERLKRKFPTAALAMLSFGHAGWASVGPKVGHLDAFHVAGDGDVA